MKDKRREFAIHFGDSPFETAPIAAPSVAIGLGIAGLVILAGVAVAGLSLADGGAVTLAIFPPLVEARKKADAKRKEFGKFMSDVKNDRGELDAGLIQSVHSMNSVDFAAKCREHQTELKDLEDEVKSFADVERAELMLKPNSDGKNSFGADIHPIQDDGKKEAKSFGRMFIESDAYADPSRLGMSPSGKTTRFDFGKGQSGIKTIMRTGAGWDPQDIRSGLVVPEATRQIQFLDVLPRIPTAQSSYVFMEETTFTNNATEENEAASTTWGEAAIAFTQQTQAVQRIGVYLPVTDEQLEDEEGAEAWINQRLPFMLRQRLDTQIITGTGTAPNLLGVLNATGLQTQAKGSDNVFDAAHKGMTLVNVTGRASADTFGFHPNDWQDIRLTRTTDGIYILGNPVNAGPTQLWGLPVVQSDQITENTGIIGDFRNFSLLVEKRGVDVQVGYHGTQFIRGEKSIRADLRVAVVWTRGAAFCQITGI